VIGSAAPRAIPDYPRTLGLREAGDRADRERDTEDLGVVPIDLILETKIADLVQAVESVQIDLRAIRQQDAVKRDGES
jgi:hypothetical protein